MRRTKQEAQLTRQRIMESAFELFLENGFENTSLEQICREAGITRGAAYWHFNNKKDLYHKTVVSTLEFFDSVRQSIVADPKLSVKSKLVELLWLPHNYGRGFEFIGKASLYTSEKEAFEDTAFEIRRDEMRFYWFFLTEVSKLEQSSIPVEHKAMMLYTIFLGLYSYPNSSVTTKNINKEAIENFVNMIIDNVS